MAFIPQAPCSYLYWMVIFPGGEARQTLDLLPYSAYPSYHPLTSPYFVLPLHACGHAPTQTPHALSHRPQVYDVRFAIRPIVTLLFPAGASSLAFHPTFSNTLAIVSMTGIVSFADIGAGSIVQTYQVSQRHTSS